MSPYELTKRDEDGTVVHEEYESTGHRVVRYIPHAIAAGTMVAISFGALGLLSGPGGLAAVLSGGEPGSVPGAFEYSAPNAPTVDLLWIDTSTVRAIGTVFAGSGDAAHDSTQVQLDRYGADFSAPLIDSISGAVTTDTLQSNDSIKADTLYSVRMRYKADPSKGGWSAWSDTAAGTAATSVAPDQFFDWGDFANITAMAADSLITEVQNSSLLSIVDTVPAVNDYDVTYDGSVRWSINSTDDVVPGWIVNVKNACNESTLGACAGGTHTSREIWERFYILWSNEGIGWSMVQPSCGSAGHKTSLFNAVGANGSERADLIFTSTAVSITMGGDPAWQSATTVDVDTIYETSGQDRWYKIERHLAYGDSVTGAAGVVEMWINDVPVHDTVSRVDSLTNPAGVHRWFNSAGMFDTYNCEEELFAQADGDSISLYMGPHELWWTQDPTWWTNKPATQKIQR